MEEQEAAETANLSPTLISLLRAPTPVPLPFSLQDLSRLRTQADTEAAKAAMQEQEAAETVGLASTRNFYQCPSHGPPVFLPFSRTYLACARNQTRQHSSASCVPPVSPPLQDLTRLRTQADTEAAKATMEEQEAAETANLSPTLISLLRAPAPVPLPLSLQDLSRLRTQADMEAAKAAMEEQEAAEITVNL
ncbi:unnamed protein product [Closterium sp. NIES-54]